MLHVVIMAGGSGTRFWPASRRALPKQFLSFGEGRTLLRQAVDRARLLVPAERIWVVTNEMHATLTAGQIPELLPSNVLAEPCGRNTAPCIGWAAAELERLGAADDDLLVTPADHVISPDEAFVECVGEAVAAIEAAPNTTVLFGVPPTYAATGFGYIERGSAKSRTIHGRVEPVPSFREKPSRDVAEQFVASGKFLWNCGIFVWKARRVLDLFALHEPELLDGVRSIATARNQPGGTDTVRRVFPTLRSISIDHAIIEKATEVGVLTANFQWDDVGSWQGLARLLGTDEHGNTVIGLHAGRETSDCVIQTTPGHLVATYGVSNAIIVHTPEATLVAARNDESALRKLVEHLETLGYGQFL
jgi:mannose-1-phosphate guanylyltransferase